jgi:hypothetical protein
MSTTFATQHTKLAPFMDHVLMGLARDPGRAQDSAVQHIGLDGLPEFFEHVQRHDGRMILVRLATEPAVPELIRLQILSFLKRTLH